MAGGIRLISTDFDGTLIGHPSDGRCVPPLARALAEFKAEGGLWALNTGRSLAHAIEGIEVFRAPVEPDFMLTHERHIFHRDASGEWAPFGDWNAVCRERHAELFQSAGGILTHIRTVLAGAKDVTWIDEDGHTAGLVTTDESVMDRVTRDLDALRREHPPFSYQRNTIYLRFCHADYHKGASLTELRRLLELKTDDVFAAGDHFNDLSMLEVSRARYLACPANAIPEVKAAVQAGGGFVSTRLHGDGIAEALSAAIRDADNKKPAAVC